MREIDLGLDFAGLGTAGTRGLARRLGFPGGAEVGSHLFRFVVFKRTGMRLLFRDSDFWKHVKNRLALNLQFSGEIVDSNLAHPPPVSSNCPAKSS
jgi:hypothetical protein